MSAICSLLCRASVRPHAGSRARRAAAPSPRDQVQLPCRPFRASPCHPPNALPLRHPPSHAILPPEHRFVTPSGEYPCASTHRAPHPPRQGCRLPSRHTCVLLLVSFRPLRPVRPLRAPRFDSSVLGLILLPSPLPPLPFLPPPLPFLPRIASGNSSKPP